MTSEEPSPVMPSCWEEVETEECIHTRWGRPSHSAHNRRSSLVYGVIGHCLVSRSARRSRGKELPKVPESVSLLFLRRQGVLIGWLAHSSFGSHSGAESGGGTREEAHQDRAGGGPVLAVRRLQRRPDQPYIRGVSDDSAGPACGLFAWWWLGGFCFAGTIIGLLTLAAVLGRPFLAFLRIGVLGAIMGLLVRLGTAQVLVLKAEGLGWDEKPRSSRLGRLVQCLRPVDRPGWPVNTPRVAE